MRPDFDRSKKERFKHLRENLRECLAEAAAERYPMKLNRLLHKVLATMTFEEQRLLARGVVDLLDAAADGGEGDDDADPDAETSDALDETGGPDAETCDAAGETDEAFDEAEIEVAETDGMIMPDPGPRQRRRGRKK